eukprot:3861689-Rhodomonas_salina.1
MWIPCSRGTVSRAPPQPQLGQIELPSKGEIETSAPSHSLAGSCRHLAPGQNSGGKPWHTQS